MVLSTQLVARSESKCELCQSEDGISALTVAPKTGENDEDNIVLCQKCAKQLDNPDQLDSNHLRCLTESIWSQEPAVQVVSYRLLNALSQEGWAQDTLGMIFLEDETLEWANSGSNAKLIHKDSNGNILSAGDSVTLIQDLNVKGASFTAKRGTAVRRIRLVHDNVEHIEGKVDGQQIVILTKYVKKS